MKEFPENAAVNWPAARRRHHLRRTDFVWLALYPFAWILLFLASAHYWFLPAGLRLAVLWTLPRPLWKWMALAEWTGILALTLWRDTSPVPLVLLVTTTMPWLVYATLVAQVGRRRATTASTGGSLPRLLACGTLAAIFNAVVLVAASAFQGGAVPHWAMGVFGYAMGDLVGIVVAAPTLLALHDQIRQRLPWWRGMLAHGWVLAPAAVTVLIAQFPIPQPLIFALVVGLFPLSLVALRYGWRPAALALAVLSATVHEHEGLLQVWRPEQVQLLLAAGGVAALLLGTSSDGLRAQGKALMLSLEQLGRRSSDLSNVANRLTVVQEQERRRMGGELHDVLGQDITAIATRLRVVERSTEDPQLRDGLHSINLLVNHAHLHLREVIDHLYPAVLDRFGLRRALVEGPLTRVARDGGLDYECDVQGNLETLSKDAGTSLYRICQEAVSNCVRHPGCTSLRILLVVGQGAAPQLVMTISDDAGELHLDPAHTGLGLQNIRDRADALGALYQFNPGNGQPRHWLSLPLQQTPVDPPAGRDAGSPSG